MGDLFRRILEHRGRGDGQVERIEPSSGDDFDIRLKQLNEQQQRNEKRVSFAELQLHAIQRRYRRQ